MRTPNLVASALSVAALFGIPLAAPAQDHGHPEGDPERVGTVSFPVSCDPAVVPAFERGVAMLHSFWFEASARRFEEVAAADPSCAMAQWGIAMTMMGNPMTRAAPSVERMEAGRAAAERARELASSSSHREQMYAASVVAYYEGEDRSHAERMAAHEAALDALRRMHPEDAEATTFYARAVVANAPPDDLTFARQRAGADLMLPLFEATPHHPGLAHYIIHAYDAPSLAAMGRDAALVYADIAPAAPHALHMPSHIFTRLGYWDESIETNARSAAAEPQPDAAVHPLDYMVYAYLQQGRDAEARAVLDRVVADTDRFYGSLLGYNLAAMPARFALERGAWREAAKLPVPEGAPPYVEAITRFARVIGATRLQTTALGAARGDAAALAQLHATLAERGDTYWATIVRAQRIAADAWVARAEGNDAGALLLAREAADVEETVEKHPVTPGPILPARELLGDLLMELGRPAEALVAYEKTLEREPRRARALFGAAQAAERAGRDAVAREHYAALLEVMEKADPTRPEPVVAKRALGRR
ncbi:MAG: hypothetical protein KY466_04425 [Gemmatimonadetes bacterium]|nr:hypothetical protein [Gemmatimonadota bacterium]